MNGVLDVANRSHVLEVDIKDMSIKQQLEPGKVKIIVLDGHQGVAKMCEAVHHGRTIIETYRGKASGFIYDEREQF